MNERKKGRIYEDVIKTALKKYGKIYPYCGKNDIHECFTILDDYIILWFNTEDGSTHTIRKKRNSVRHRYA